VALFLAGALAGSFAGAATIVVNDATDTLHSSGCAALGTGTCTLRDAITFANANSGADEIHFDIAGTGVQTIVLGSDLPVIAGDLTIDGYTQSGSSPNTNGPGLGDNAVLMIEINGNGKECLGFEVGLLTVRGLVINRCGGYGVRWVIGDVLPSAVVAGNFIGTDPTGTAAHGNAGGVAGIPIGVGGAFPTVTVGGDTPGDRNVISGNTGVGVANPTSVLGNFIGTDATGTVAIPNGTHGVELDDSSTEQIIGGNLISGNLGIGIYIHEFGLVDSIQDNWIGTDVTGTLPLGNGSKGIFVNFGFGGAGSITGNVIAFNGSVDPNGAGIEWRRQFLALVSPVMLGNSIFDNTSDGSVPNRGL
jgi:hypothetical protein